MTELSPAARYTLDDLNSVQKVELGDAIKTYLVKSFICVAGLLVWEPYGACLESDPALVQRVHMLTDAGLNGRHR